MKRPIRGCKGVVTKVLAGRAVKGVCPNNSQCPDHQPKPNRVDLRPQMIRQTKGDQP